MSIPVQYNDIILGLLRKSQENNVVWNTTTDANTFIVYFDNFSLSIRQHYNSDFNNNYHETWMTVDLIKNENGDKIDGFMVEEGDGDWGTMSELYTLARRSALSIDIAVQEMLTEITTSEVIGKKKKTMDNLQKLMVLPMIYRFKHQE
jgi:hypothetical protein